MQAPQPTPPATPTKSRHARKWTPQLQMLLLLSIVDASPRSIDWDKAWKLMDERMGSGHGQGEGQGEMVSVRALRSQLSAIRTDLARHSFRFSHFPAKQKNPVQKHKGFYHGELVILGDDEDDDDNMLRAGRMREIGIKVEGEVKKEEGCVEKEEEADMMDEEEGGVKKEEGVDMVEAGEGEGETKAKVSEKRMEMLGGDVGEDGWDLA